VFGSALAGRSKQRPELAATPLPLTARLAALPCRGGEDILKRLFEPLGYTVTARRHPLDENVPEWGQSPYFTITLESVCRLQDLLSHLYVLVPVLDDEKHYWVGEDEVAKLLRHGGDWLARHPDRELIVNRYLRYQRRLTSDAMLRLMDEDQGDPDALVEQHAQEEQEIEARIGLNEQRTGAVMAALRSADARRVLDLGCGEGRLLRALLEDRRFEKITGMDVSHRALEHARERLHLGRRPAADQARIEFLHGSLLYRDRRLAGYDAAVAMEVIEHLDPARLSSFERVVFEFARPKTVVVTTPNADYNVNFADLPAGRFRHKDHRFEWTRTEFETWTADIGHRFGYATRTLPVGTEIPGSGAPTQMAVFTFGEQESSFDGDSR
jgi:3' terminal RNA ribose 2'-O-methyltransferase Hen1